MYSTPPPHGMHAARMRTLHVLWLSLRSMDVQVLVQALTNTLDHNLREQAEALLEEVSVYTY